MNGLRTPRGLKVRLDPSYAFALLQRLAPKVAPVEVLATTEAIERVPPACACVVGTAAVILGQSPAAVGGSVAVTYAAFGAFTQYSLFLFGPVVALGRIYRLRGPFLIVLALACAWRGWRVALALLGGRAVGGAANWVLELVRSRRYVRMLGRTLTGAEINFFSAYRLHARAAGQPISIEVSDEREIERGRTLLDAFRREWPRLVDEPS